MAVRKLRSHGGVRMKLELKLVALALVTVATFVMTSTTALGALLLAALGWLAGVLLLILAPADPRVSVFSELLSAAEDAFRQMREQYEPGDDECASQCEWCSLYQKLELAIRRARKAID